MIVPTTLNGLAVAINDALANGDESSRAGIAYYRQAGEMLLRAKDKMPHGKWMAWLQENITCGSRQARRYMLLAKMDSESNLEDIWQTISGRDDTNWVDKQCASQEWFTPLRVLSCVREYFGGAIPLDPATTLDNPAEAQTFFTAADDGLTKSWNSGVFVNPPYGEVLPAWCEKIHTEADRNTEILALLPCGARSSTAYWQDHVLNDCLKVICFVRGRVAFLGPEGEKAGNPYDSCIYGFNADAAKFRQVFTELGKVFP
jgi:hypothetical protein